MIAAETGAWRKLGLVFKGPSAGHPALLTHAALPVPVSMGGDLVRIFYSGRDAANRSSVGSVVLRLSEVPRIEEEGREPILLPGGIGAFDDAGVSLGCIVPGPDGDRLYYMGWNVGGSARWRTAIGVAVGNARDAKFERPFLGPIMDRAPLDPYSLTYPWVLRFGPDRWRMWFGTSLRGGARESDIHHAIRMAVSANGMDWTRSPAICLPTVADEIAVVRPTILANPDDGFDMFFAARGLDGPYGIGHAFSADGESWTRSPAGITASPEGWEGGAVAYPAVFEQLGRRWLLYNGRGYGATGFGIAVWEAG